MKWYFTCKCKSLISFFPRVPKISDHLFCTKCEKHVDYEGGTGEKISVEYKGKNEKNDGFFITIFKEGKQ